MRRQRILSVLAASVLFAGLGTMPAAQASAYTRDDAHQFALTPAAVGRQARQTFWSIRHNAGQCMGCYANSAAGSAYQRDGLRVAAEQDFSLPPINHAGRLVMIEVSVFATVGGARDFYSRLGRPSNWPLSPQQQGAWAGTSYPSSLSSYAVNGYTDAMAIFRAGNIVVHVDAAVDSFNRAVLPVTLGDACRVGRSMVAVVAAVLRRGGFAPQAPPAPTAQPAVHTSPEYADIVGSEQELGAWLQYIANTENSVATGLIPASSLRDVASAYLDSELDFRATLTSTPMTGRYGGARASLLAGFDALHRACQRAVASGGHSYDASDYREAGADLQKALGYVS